MDASAGFPLPPKELVKKCHNFNFMETIVFKTFRHLGHFEDSALEADNSPERTYI